ncbi:hypothetical protein F0237_02600 [Vibrio tubiashii]|uniref:Trimeric autotransporter adhesin YadA-like C-terminal membrane anchor domain-containing protein n=1 Tax=Vibrio tubiashii TaxID=29498 RepID=A0AAE5LGQ5_9VIBR|nr:YadA C-terminal domain-containing protein [Vibrio tubiashii]NOI79538.1 hypothetical protein [Vibrio tubiashii]
MKKTLLALTVTSLFSGAAFASTNSEIDLEQVKAQLEYKKDANGEIDYNTVVVKQDGTEFTVVNNGDDKYTLVQETNTEGGAATKVDVDAKTGNYTVKDKYNDRKIADGTIIDRSNWNPNNGAIVDVTSANEQVNLVVDALDNASNSNQKVTITHFDKETEEETKIELSGQDLIDAKNTLANMGERERVEFAKELAKVKSVDTTDEANSNNGSNKVIDQDTRNQEISDEVDRRIVAESQAAQNWAAYAEQQFKQEVARLDAKIDNVEGRVSNGAAMAGAMTQMQFGHDGFGVGAGVANFNGSNAIAVGVGYAFGSEKQWMAKGSFGYAKSNKGNKSADTMAAAGLTYSFK